ncbi:DUF3836 domain-containing protein [Mucilaginibacter myungsuensis]|uniref:YD repeat-containing protein n=1 Tax=Mucilaginibacter myungsuensis TaxID=649104 RepID=A0A929KUX3_9SPHI|nr:DUF3836 domain-containing protein [Mucilaginibacter myungsuensis]MBE9662036.1 hypothetical protein [Mucilaginibacter myungsuensis]MDN3599531.1 DUF3836 domain-containing protein [Mucilaginibacter myungsuensis]
MLKTITRSAAVAMFAAASIFATSCKKDKEVVTNPTITRQLVKIEEGTDNTTFEYNGDNKLSKMVTKDGPTTTNIDFTYDATKKLTVASMNLVQLKFAYNGNSISKVEYFSTGANPALTGYTEFTTQNGRVSEIKAFAKSGNVVTPFYKITYAYNAAGSVTTQTQYMWSPLEEKYELNETTTFEYDAKVNPLTITSDISATFYSVVSANNITKEVTKDALNQVVETSIYTYTYDDKGYPTIATKKTTTKENPNEVTATLKYTYKN